MHDYIIYNPTFIIIITCVTGFAVFKIQQCLNDSVEKKFITPLFEEIILEEDGCVWF
jgi:hypothetical protein